MWTPSPALPLKENLRDFWKMFVDAAKVSPQTLHSPYQHPDCDPQPPNALEWPRPPKKSILK